MRARIITRIRAIRANKSRKTPYSKPSKHPEHTPEVAFLSKRDRHKIGHRNVQKRKREGEGKERLGKLGAVLVRSWAVQKTRQGCERIKWLGSNVRQGLSLMRRKNFSIIRRETRGAPFLGLFGMKVRLRREEEMSRE